MTSLTNDTKSSGIWLKSTSSLSMSLISDSLSFSIDSIPPELRGDPYALRHSFTLDPSTMDEQKAYHCYGLEQDGALRPGGQISLFTRRTIGLLLNYFAIGAMFGGMNSAIVPFLRKYLLLEQYQVKDTKENHI
ncbi:unnamed protein product [Peronospora belbahrii]|uniref:Uncharacterized protein n=1 Tax=Peronospora belbahrii TaxID=622444 RepID=A0ABN8D3X4_9STRA|nr:unnamed protein product [Peronospora belbahrii]